MQRAMTAIFLALTPVGALGLGPAAPAHAQQLTVSISLFHQQLSSHGRWFQHPRYGWAWFPTAVDAQWRPYSHGQWVWTEQYGWYWNSDEPFGWATYHYGRWGYDEVYGWVWIPGSTWGPAWVAFRYSEGHVGWAPLPPETLQVSFNFNSGYTDMNATYYEPRWVFVPRNRFLDARIYSSAVPRNQNSTYIRQTINVTNYVTINNVIVNRSIDPQRMESAIGRRIEAAKVNDVDNLSKSGRRGDKAIDAYRPQVRVTREDAPPAAARAKPSDKPRYAIEKDGTAPAERRTAPAQPASPPPRSDRDTRPEGTPEKAVPPAATRPGTPPERSAKPSEPSAAPPPATPPATQIDRNRKAQPDQPPDKVAPSGPQTRTPPQPPKRSTAPAKPGEPRAVKPPATAETDRDRNTRPNTSPPDNAKPDEPSKKDDDDKKKDEKPGR